MTQAEATRAPAGAKAPEPVFRLIYRSHSQIPADGLDAELGKILQVARANNARRGISGALLLYEDWFAQTLEGPEEEVRLVYDTIARDKRHGSLEVREQGIVPARVFSRWSMALVGEHGNADVPLVATATGTTPAADWRTTAGQDSVLDLMRNATRGYGRGS
jgi:Sensors of blue-light using FAD